MFSFFASDSLIGLSSGSCTPELRGNDHLLAERKKRFAHKFFVAGVIALVGNTMRTGYTAPKILWLRQNEPRIGRGHAASCFLMIT
jgi:hypothetical protein